MTFKLLHVDCFDWLREAKRQSEHAVVTDPPYGLVEFSDRERDILKGGQAGGVWRIPPAFDGSQRNPLPRFTVLGDAEKTALRQYMADWGAALMPVLVPGAHVCVAGNPSLQYLVQAGMAEAGFEVRSAIMRLYVGLRGGDRPKLAEREFSGVSVSPRGGYEPWMLFRKPISERTVAENLRRWKTGGLRRLAEERPFPDIIPSGRTPDVETDIARHPTIKPQHLLRILVRAMLPCAEGLVLDTFAGSGSTLAAAEAIGYESIGTEIDAEYYADAVRAVPLLARMYPAMQGDTLALPATWAGSNGAPRRRPRSTPQGSLL